MQIQVSFFQHVKLALAYPFPFLAWLVKAVPGTIKIVVFHQCFLWVSLQCSKLDLKIPRYLEVAGLVLWCVTKKKRKHASKSELWQSQIGCAIIFCVNHWKISLSTMFFNFWMAGLDIYSVEFQYLEVASCSRSHILLLELFTSRIPDFF